MTVLVTGTADSGKSALAEDLAMQTGDVRRYYLATMKVCDDDGRKRVEKHRKMREGKGFVTIERQCAISGITNEIDDPGEVTVLLECVSNLVGNMLHDRPGRAAQLLSDRSGRTAFADEAAGDIAKLAGMVHNLIIVTNEYETEDGFDEETGLYVELLGAVNARLCDIADRKYDLRADRQ